jgi:hypothetical protein
MSWMWVTSGVAGEMGAIYVPQTYVTYDAFV